MDEREQLIERFEGNRTRLRALAYQALGSLTEADDAIQETWLRLSRAGSTDIQNLEGWLTTVLSRVCLDMLRSRTRRREEPLDAHVPDPVVSGAPGMDPEHEALLADSVGLAMLVVLDTLTPAERLAFILHDVFAMPFEDIAFIVERSPAAARQLASRARRRVHASPVVPDVDLPRQQEVVNAFLTASRSGDFEALLTVLDPDVVLRLDRGPIPARASRTVRGAESMAQLAFRFSGDGWLAQPAIVNGAAGVVVSRHGQVFSVIGFIVRGDKVVEIDILADPARIRALPQLGTLAIER